MLNQLPPSIIRYSDEERKRTINSPEKVECGRSFKVLHTAADDKISKYENGTICSN